MGLLRPSWRLIAVLLLQAGVVGLLATGALGTAKTGLSGATPQPAAGVDAAHDTSVPLADAPDVPLDPNRSIPEYESAAPASVAVTPHDPVLQAAAASPAIAATTTSFLGIRVSDLSVRYYPPDTVGDVGLTQYVEAVNGGLEVFSKTGASLTGAITDDSFWDGLSPCDTDAKSDPTLNYDQFANRWVYSEITTTAPYNECVAVSTSDDATGSWNRYAFDLGSSVFPDYPKLAVWPDGYYFSFNDFAGSSLKGVGALALERSAMLNGTSAQMVWFDLANVQTLPFGILPADADGATPPANGAPDLFAGPNDDPSGANNDQLGIWAFHVDWSAPGGSTFTNVQNLAVSPFDGIGLSVPQPGGAPALDSLAHDQLMNRLQYRNFGGYETLVANETINNAGHDAPRWYELRSVGGVWSVNQQGTFAPDAVNRWMGSAAMNGTGDIALGYSAGDSSTNPGLRFTGRVSTDPLGSMQAESVLQAGGGTQTGASRWGDYSQMAVDPDDDCTFWYVGEYYTGTANVDWATRVGSMRFGTCSGASGPRYTVVPVVSGTTKEGRVLSTTAGTWSPAPTSTAYQWRRCDLNGLSCVDLSGATGTTYTLTPADVDSRIRVKVTVTAATGTGSVVSSATASVLPLAPVSTSPPVVTGTAQLGQTLAATDGTWTSAVVPDFTFQWQRCASGCADISGANQSTYSLTNPGDVGATIRVRVTATNDGGSATATSAQTATVQQAPAPVNTLLPVVSGAAMVGNVLNVNFGTWSGVAPITPSYQWQSCSSTGANCAPVSGLTGASYLLTAADVGTRLRVVVTATNSGGGSSVNTAVTSVVVPQPPVNTVLPALGGTAQVATTLTLSTGTWAGAAPITYAYAWQSCSSAGSSCATISGASGSSYTLTLNDLGKTVRGAVTATNGGGSTQAISNASAVVVAAASGGGSSGGGGGGGGGGTPDLALTGFASPATPTVGSNVTLAYTVTDKNLAPATKLTLTVTLPAGVSFLSASANRGSGCVQSQSNAAQVVCNLDYVSSDSPTASVFVFGHVTAAAASPVSASVSSDLGDLASADNSLDIPLTATAQTAGGAPAGLNGTGGTSTVKTVDKKVPTTHALASSGRRGVAAKLRFKIYDDSGVAKAVAYVQRNGKNVGTAKTGFGNVAFGSVYYVGWRVPRAASKGRYTFCVVAYDRAAHHSTRSCAPLALR